MTNATNNTILVISSTGKTGMRVAGQVTFADFALTTRAPRQGASLSLGSTAALAGVSRKHTTSLMTGSTPSPTHIARIALTGAVIGLGALATAAQANADPLPPPCAPEPCAVPPGQPVVEAPGSEPIAAPAPPPVGAPVVPEVPNAQYGQGSRPGPLGFLRDAWAQAKDPYGFTGTPPGQMPSAAAPPPGAGPAPQLPPGYESLTDPASNGPPVAPNTEGGPPLPEGYYPLDGPPPPGYFDPPPTIVPVPTP